MAAHLARQRLPIHERRIRLSHIFRKIKSHHLRHRLRAALVPFAWQLVLVCQTCASAKWARFVVQMGRVERDQLRRGWLTSCRFLGWKELKERENTMTYHDIPWHTVTYRDNHKIRSNCAWTSRAWKGLELPELVKRPWVLIVLDVMPDHFGSRFLEDSVHGRHGLGFWSHCIILHPLLCHVKGKSPAAAPATGGSGGSMLAK